MERRAPFPIPIHGGIVSMTTGRKYALIKEYALNRHVRLLDFTVLHLIYTVDFATINTNISNKSVLRRK